MPVSVNLQTVQSRTLAAVRRGVAPGAVASAWGPALGKVWEFIRSQAGLWTDGHNIFLYHHPNQPGAPILCDFGVEVTRAFETAGEVYMTETPGGEAAVAVHRGPYNRMHEAHNAIGRWIAANRRESAGRSWEISDFYGYVAFAFRLLLSVMALVVAVWVFLLGLVTLAVLRVAYPTLGMLGYPLTKTFLQAPAAPPWAGQGKNETVIWLPVPPGLTTLGVGPGMDLSKALLDAENTAYTRLNQIGLSEDGRLPGGGRQK